VLVLRGETTFGAVLVVEFKTGAEAVLPSPPPAFLRSPQYTRTYTFLLPATPLAFGYLESASKCLVLKVSSGPNQQPLHYLVSTVWTVR
jgi:hypothetical protein